MGIAKNYPHFIMAIITTAAAVLSTIKKGLSAITGSHAGYKTEQYWFEHRVKCNYLQFQITQAKYLADRGNIKSQAFYDLRSNYSWHRERLLEESFDKYCDRIGNVLSDDDSFIEYMRFLSGGIDYDEATRWFIQVCNSGLYDISNTGVLIYKDTGKLADFWRWGEYFTLDSTNRIPLNTFINYNDIDSNMDMIDNDNISNALNNKSDNIDIGGISTNNKSDNIDIGGISTNNKIIFGIGAIALFFILKS